MPPVTEAQTKANNRAFFVNTLQELGIGLNGNLNNLINNALAQNFNSATFMRALRRTKEYRQRFTGIFRADGRMKMSESQYLSNERLYETYASKAGINLSPRSRDWLFINNVSPSEFANRAQAITTLRRNPDLYQSFRRELIQNGIDKNPTRKGLLKFILGRGNSQWYDLWNDAVTRNAAVQAGLAVGRRNAIASIPQGVVERISGLGLSQEAVNRGFEQLADDISTILPDAQLFGQKLTVSDLVTLRFGGKDRQAIKDRVDSIIATRNLQAEGQAQPPLLQKQGGGTSLAYGGLSGEEGE